MPDVTGQGRNLRWSAIASASASDFTIVPAIPGKRINVVGYLVAATTNISFQFKSGASVFLTGPLYPRFAGKNIIDMQSIPKSPLMILNTNQPLIFRPSANQNTGGWVQYYYDSVVNYS